MKIARFTKMTVSVPIKDDETIEEIEDRLVGAVDSIGDDDDVVMSYFLEIEEYEDE